MTTINVRGINDRSKMGAYFGLICSEVYLQRPERQDSTKPVAARALCQDDSVLAQTFRQPSSQESV